MEKKKRNGVSSVLPEKSIAVEGRKGLAMPMNKVSGSKKKPEMCSCAQLYRIERQVFVFFFLILVSTFILPITVTCCKFTVINLFQHYDIMQGSKPLCGNTKTSFLLLSASAAQLCIWPYMKLSSEIQILVTAAHYPHLTQTLTFSIQLS